MSRTAAVCLSVSLVVLSIATAQTLAQPPQPKGPAARPIVFEVRVPAEAEVEIQGRKMTTTGEVRQYRTPPVPLGQKYSYTVKVTYGGKTSAYEVQLKHGGANVLDLQKTLFAGKIAKPATPGPFALIVPPTLSLRPGDAAPFTVKVKRDNFADAIEIAFKNLPAGVTISEATIAAGKDEQSFLLMSGKDAKPGTATIEIVAKSGKAEKLASIRLTIDPTAAAPTVDAKKPPEKPKPPPADLPQDDPPMPPASEKKPESKKAVEKKP